MSMASLRAERNKAGAEYDKATAKYELEVKCEKLTKELNRYQNAYKEAMVALDELVNVREAPRD